MSVQISVVHYADEDELYFNDVVALLIKSIHELTDYPYKLKIIDNQMHPRARRDLEERLPDVEILRNDGASRLYPAACNTAIKDFDTDYLCILHTDCLASWGWLTWTVNNLKKAEKKYGAPCATTFKLLPYPMSLELVPWDNIIKKIVTPEKVISELDKWKFPWKIWNSLPIAVSRPGLVTDHGWQLGVYMASREFFDEVGLMDDKLCPYADLDYGMRALATRCRSLISEKVVIHHVGALHRKSGIYTTHWNYEGFVEKWGEPIMQQLKDGTIWIELHKRQREKYGQ